MAIVLLGIENKWNCVGDANGWIFTKAGTMVSFTLEISEMWRERSVLN